MNAGLLLQLWSFGGIRVVYVLPQEPGFGILVIVAFLQQRW